MLLKDVVIVLCVVDGKQLAMVVSGYSSLCSTFWADLSVVVPVGTGADLAAAYAVLFTVMC